MEKEEQAQEMSADVVERSFSEEVREKKNEVCC